MPSTQRWDPDQFAASIEARRRRERWYKPGLWMLWALRRRIGDAWCAVRYAYQRVNRGWDDRAGWNVDHYLAKNLGQQLVMMAEIAHGCPDEYGGNIHSIPDNMTDDPRFVQWVTDLKVHGEALLTYHRESWENYTDDAWSAIYQPAQEALRWVADHLATLWD